MVGLEVTSENRCFFTQFTSRYLLGVEAADFLVGGVLLGGGGALGDGVAAEAAVLTAAVEAVRGEAETATASVWLELDCKGISSPVIGRMTSKRLSSAELEVEVAATSAWILV